MPSWPIWVHSHKYDSVHSSDNIFRPRISQQPNSGFSYCLHSIWLSSSLASSAQSFITLLYNGKSSTERTKNYIFYIAYVLSPGGCHMQIDLSWDPTHTDAKLFHDTTAIVLRPGPILLPCNRNVRKSVQVSGSQTWMFPCVSPEITRFCAVHSCSTSEGCGITFTSCICYGQVYAKQIKTLYSRLITRTWFPSAIHK